MAGEATALVTFAHRSVHGALHGPAGSRIWRPGFAGCLIEKHLPMWVVTPIGFAAGQEPEHLVAVPNGHHDLPAVADLILVIAGLFGGSERLRQLAAAEGLLHQRGSVWWVEPMYEPDNDTGDDEAEVEPQHASEDLYLEAIRVVAGEARATVCAYPGSILSRQDTVTWMRGVGIDVDEFVYAPVGQQGVER